MSEAATLTTLDAKIKRLQILETTEESASALHGNPIAVTPPTTSETAAARSQYRQAMNNQRTLDLEGGSEESRICKGCGDPFHEGGRARCPAINKKCKNCKLKGHLAKVCMKPKSRATPIHDDTSAHNDEPEHQRIPSESAVSFSFGASQDFRSSRRIEGRR